MYALPQQAFAFSEMVGSEDLGKGSASQLEQALAAKVDSYLASSDLVTLIGTCHGRGGRASGRRPAPTWQTTP